MRKTEKDMSSQIEEREAIKIIERHFEKEASGYREDNTWYDYAEVFVGNIANIIKLYLCYKEIDDNIQNYALVRFADKEEFVGEKEKDKNHLCQILYMKLWKISSAPPDDVQKAIQYMKCMKNLCLYPADGTTDAAISWIFQLENLERLTLSLPNRYGNEWKDCRFAKGLQNLTLNYSKWNHKLFFPPVMKQFTKLKELRLIFPKDINEEINSEEVILVSDSKSLDQNTESIELIKRYLDLADSDLIDLGLSKVPCFKNCRQLQPSKSGNITVDTSHSDINKQYNIFIEQNNR